MEMSKDLERDCPGVRMTINQQVADYTVLLNHIEVGFARDNQIQVANVAHAEGKTHLLKCDGCTSPEWASVIGSLFWALSYGM